MLKYVGMLVFPEVVEYLYIRMAKYYVNVWCHMVSRLDMLIY
jgi:hypothetical protein